MKRYTILILICTVWVSNLFAYPFTISGSITDNSGAPVINQEVTIYSLSLNNPEKRFTDATGNYSIQINIPGNFFPDFYVQTWSWCDNEFTNYTEVVTSFNGTAQINFNICQQVNIPNVCIASFEVEFINNHVLGFINTSYGIVESQSWDLGDSFTSTEQNVTYNYPQHGLFHVCLGIHTTGNCDDQVCKQVPVGSWEQANGFVEMNNSSLPAGLLYVYQITGNNKSIVWTSIVEITNGEFNIPYLLFNDYFIQAIPVFNISEPYFPKYLPTYYGGSLLWQEADSIPLTGGNPFLNIDLLSYNEMYFGHGSICGNISRFDSISSEGGPPWLTGNIAAPVTVFLMDNTNTALDFRLFEESGSFCFNDIPYGNYRLRVEKFRSMPFYVDVSISEESPDVNNLSIEAYQSQFILGTQNLINEYKLFSIYPNPAMEKLNINYTGPIPYNIEIFNCEGKSVYSNQHSGFTGDINIEYLINGIYIISLTNSENERLTEKFQKIN